MHDRANELAARDKRRRRPSAHLKPKAADMSMIEDDEVAELPDEDGGLAAEPLKRDVDNLPDEEYKADPYYQELEALRDALMNEDESANAPAIRCVEEQMKERQKQLNEDKEKAARAEMRAEEKMHEQYPFLGNTATGEPLSQVGLKDDDEFMKLADEYAKKKADPKTPRADLAALEHAMKVRAQEVVAAGVKEEKDLHDRMPFVGALPTGVQLRDLCLESRPDVQKLLAQLDELAKDPETANGPEAKRLEKELNDLIARAAEDEAELLRRHLTDAENMHERFPFLPEEPVDGITLRDAGVMEDPEFRALANQLEDLKKEDPVKNAPKIKGLEDKLKDRAEELAKDVKDATDEAKEKYPFLPKRVNDELLGNLPLDTDEKFQELANQLEELKKEDPVKNADEIKALEDQLRDRAEELAGDEKALDILRHNADEEVRARNPFLKTNDVRGVPLRELELNKDPEYNKLYDSRLQLMEDPVKNADKIKAVEEKLKDRADELAKKKLDEEARLEATFPTVKRPKGAAMLSSLNVGGDPIVSNLMKQRAALSEDPAANQDAIRAIDQQMAERIQELVDEDVDDEKKAAKARMNVLRQYPMCARDVSEAVGRDAVFAELHAEREGLLSDPVANKAPITEKEKALRERGIAVESSRRRRRQRDRPTCLLQMDDVVLEEGDLPEDYHKRRNRHRTRRALNVGEVPDMTPGELREREADTELPPQSRRVATLRYNDPYYQELQALRDALMNEDESANAPAIRCVEEQMKERQKQLNEDKEKAARAEMRAEEKMHEQYPFLGNTATGEPLSQVGLKDDDEFMKLADEYAKKKADPKTPRADLAALEHAMKVRAQEVVAAGVKEEKDLHDRMPFVGALPTGVQLRDLCLESRAGRAEATRTTR
ncbi:calpain-like cysteine peptidase [Angomonas deanei]|nr:calpain-like cysteine peptidase [Angomonas deanei]|eukprot:EPY29704.1 calpain-like cysteine peptidase [Angomonas deanei]